MARVEFADGLRGVAAVLVVASHVMAAFWLDRAGTLGPLGLQPHEGPNPLSTNALSQTVSALSLGAFGVGLFFLISGFVVPYSLERYRPVPFLAARAVRLLPPYAAGFLVGMAALAASFRWRAEPFPFEPEHVALHAIVGMRALVAFERIDGMVWTLEIGVCFYVLCALAAGWLAKGRLLAFLLPAALFCACLVMHAALAADAAASFGRVGWKAMTVVALYAPFMIFMFIGVAFNFHHRGLIGRPALAVLVAALMGMFVAGAALTPSPLTTEAVKSYAAALLVFSAVQRMPQAWAAWPPVRWLAAISYPLYAVHAVLGYVLMWHLARAGLAPDLVVLAAWLVALLAAVAVHRLVERPTATLARGLARELSREPRRGWRADPAQPQHPPA